MPLPQNYKIAGVLSCLYQRDKINAFVLSQVREFRNVFNNNNNREIVFRFVTRTKKQVYYTMRNRVSDICQGSDPPLRLCDQLGHEVVGNLDFLHFFLDFFTEFRSFLHSHSVHESSGDRLEKLDQVEGLIKDAVENWSSFQEAYRDAHPSEGYMID